jgi:hypothetical protein
LVCELNEHALLIVQHSSDARVSRTDQIRIIIVAYVDRLLWVKHRAPLKAPAERSGRLAAADPPSSKDEAEVLDTPWLNRKPDQRLTLIGDEAKFHVLLTKLPRAFASHHAP